MLELLVVLAAIVFVGGIVVAVFAAAIGLAKLVFNIVLLPLKLLFLPLVFLLVFVKVVVLGALIVAAIGVVIGVLVPLAIVFCVVAAPFVLIAAFS